MVFSFKYSSLLSLFSWIIKLTNLFSVSVIFFLIIISPLDFLDSSSSSSFSSRETILATKLCNMVIHNLSPPSIGLSPTRDLFSFKVIKLALDILAHKFSRFSVNAEILSRSKSIIISS